MEQSTPLDIITNTNFPWKKWIVQKKKTSHILCGAQGGASQMLLFLTSHHLIGSAEPITDI